MFQTCLIITLLLLKSYFENFNSNKKWIILIIIFYQRNKYKLQKYKFDLILSFFQSILYI